MFISPQQREVQRRIADFVQSVTGSPCVIGQVNRVPSPKGDYSVIWPLRFVRLGTNLDQSTDAKFMGSISDVVLTITEVFSGTLTQGQTLDAIGIGDGTIITNQIDGADGGIGTYTVSVPQTLGASIISAGAKTVQQDTEAVFQCDLHGDMAVDQCTVLQTLFRDEYGVDFMEPFGVTPLYADDPRQTAFVTAADQYENRMSIDLHVQINPVVSIPQQFSDGVDLTVVDVDVVYPEQ